MKKWLQHHRYALSGAWHHLRKPRGGIILNLIVIAIALMLPFAGITLLENIRPVSAQLTVEPEISVFLSMDTPRDQATALATPMRRMLQAAKINGKLEFIPREKALSGLDAKTGLSAIVATLGSNPLPDGYVIRFAALENLNAANKIDQLVGQFAALPGVEHVQLDSAWIKRLAAIMQVWRLALLILGAALGTVVVAVVFNTIRLQVMHHREEIELSRLVGATNNFIAQPFYYAGAFLGLAAGMLALLLVALALQPLNHALAELVRLYGSDFQLVPPSASTMAWLLAASAGLGWLGAVLSVRRTLSRLG